jgi:beta-barrel assembly-enhancing protease
VRLDWDAVYLDGRSAARQRATARIGRVALEITLADSNTRLLWPYREIRQTQGTYAGEHVRLERGGDLSEALLVADVGFLSALRAAAPDTHFHNPARRRFRAGLIVVAGVAAIALGVGLYLFALPAVAAVAAERVPVQWEAKLGDAIVEHIAPVSARCVDGERQARIDALAAAVLKPVGTNGYTFRIAVADTPTVNALAAPGGAIVVFRGLLDRTDSAEELAGVLAHEFQHVLHRHATRAIFQHASAGILMAAVVGDVSAVVAFGLEGARMLGDLSMSRQAEAQADRDGMQMLHEAGIDTAGMVTFFEKLAELQGDPGRGKYLMSHPAPQERLATMRALSAQWPRPATRLLPGYDWNDIKSMCASAPPRESPAR